MAIDLQAAAQDYADRAASAGGKLVRKYKARTDKLARASSDEAQRAYVTAISDPKVQARRQSKLKRLSEQDLNNAMEAKGAANYASGVQAGAPKWEKGFSPYAPIIDATVAGFPAKTRDVASNVSNRVTKLAQALRAKKDSMT